jgi:hypothetical protein
VEEVSLLTTLESTDEDREAFWLSDTIFAATLAVELVEDGATEWLLRPRITSFPLSRVDIDGVSEDRPMVESSLFSKSFDGADSSPKSLGPATSPEGINIA